MKHPVGIITVCGNCESEIAFVCVNWAIGKRFTIPCVVCGEEYYVAFTIKPVKEATETPVPKSFLRAWDNGV